MAVLRESYKESTEDLRHYAEKVRAFNDQKKAIREYLVALRTFRSSVLSSARERSVDLCRANRNDLAGIAKAFKEHARAHDVGAIGYELCIPSRVPAPTVTTLSHVNEEITRWEERLAALDDEAQLSNVDLQNMLQKQQQALQLLSNVSKTLHETAASIIRKIGG
jgi:hypothetical protein